MTHEDALTIISGLEAMSRGMGIVIILLTAIASMLASIWWYQK